MTPTQPPGAGQGREPLPQPRTAIDYAGLIGHFVSMHIGAKSEDEDDRLAGGYVVEVMDWDASPNVDIVMVRERGDRYVDHHTIKPGENWRFSIRSSDR